MLYHKIMSESRNDGKAGLGKFACLTKVLKDKRLKGFKPITAWKWLDEAGEEGGIFNFVRDEETRGRPPFGLHARKDRSYPRPVQRGS